MKIRNNKEAKRTTSLALRQYALLAILFIIMIFLLPPNSETMHLYHFSALEYRTVVFAVALPGLAVWLAAFIGYAKLREYAYAIRKTPEGIYFDQLADGCTWLAWSLPIGAIIPFFLNTIANQHTSFHAAAIIMSNYINLLLPLVAFSIIAQASRGLMSTVKINLSLINVRALILAFMLLGVLFCFSTFRFFDLSSFSSSDNPYFLPIWLMLLTITVPYLYAWFLGLLSIYEITLFSRRVKGVFYQQALGMLVYGLLAVILSSIALQYINSVEPRVGHLIFDYRFALNTLFRTVGGGGFILLAFGAHRLKKIEEV